MKIYTYYIFMLSIVSCVAQKHDNIGMGNVPGKDINIGIRKESDPLKKLEAGANLITDIIGTLNETLAVGIKPNDGQGYKIYKHNQYDGNDYKFELDAGNPDNHAKIERPCEVYDTFCIRGFFAQHSKCKITGRPVPDPLFRAQVTANYPRVNIGASQTNIEYKGLSNARIEEFYINKVTDNLIIALEFDAISIFSNNTYLKFYVRGREPIVTTDFGGLVYGKFSITVIIPHLNDLKLDKAEIYTFANSPVVSFVTGPRLAASSDPEVFAMFATFIANLQVNEQEALLTEGNFYAATYIQYNICDFGLKLL